MARATAQPIDDLIARNGIHPSGEWQLCVIGTPLIVDCEQKLLPGRRTDGGHGFDLALLTGHPIDLLPAQ
jgi:hypothetical protein